MQSKMRRIVLGVVLLVAVSLLGGCVTPGGLNLNMFENTKIEKTVASYEAEGLRWGARHWNWKEKERLRPGEIDQQFVDALIAPNYLDFFWVHSDLKDAFKKGYRLGYQDRTADLVLGPNLTTAAEKIGELTGDGFVKVINSFEDGWATTLKQAIDVFITLISEGSQADREKFINKFIEVYKTKYNATRKMLKEGAVMKQVSEGGTLLFIDYSKGKALGALDIPSDVALKTEIYHQAFKVMGDEWGRRYSTNLIKRDELVDLLRRSKTALEEVKPGLRGNLDKIRVAFRNSYGTDADSVFRSLAKEAGY